MRILLDECVPRRFARELEGHDVRTVRDMGWLGVKNGKLLNLIVSSAQFDAFVTVDKNLPHQQNLAAFSLILVILHAPSNRMEDLRDLIPELLAKLPNAAKGTVLHIGASTA